MDTTRLQENISAMVDGELPDCDVELTMAALAAVDGRTRWHAYQLIGDVLRADAAGAGLSGAFRERLAARLAQEAFPAEPDDEAPPAQAPSDLHASTQASTQAQSGPQAATQAQPPAPPPSPQGQQSSSPLSLPQSPPSPPPGDPAPAALGTR